ncbi:hypothetical protein [Streptomyces griseosporeus]|uniref:hypothetical protein n=1 Tax=Streptomyces griseosporeus TaxID=1910 RepID=UPI00167EDDDE|nr:hypothetical protein [Streptomyces griseosporeus]GHF60904.1 hypothetical protein GCM10018783_32420 [Streptomyces griseosporeus]
MATKTEDQAADTPAAGTTADEGTTEEETAAEEAAPEQAGTGEAAAEEPEGHDETPAGQDGPSGVGQGAGAVVAAALGLVSLTGSWIGTVASARESLIGQLQTSSSSSVATMVKEGYGDAWHANALWAGLFALLALVTGVVVLARPAFGAPGRPQAPWIKSVAWAGVALGVLGLLLAVLKYTDVLLGLPSA